jgi:hypothetical protein
MNQLFGEAEMEINGDLTYHHAQAHPIPHHGMLQR